MALSASFFWVYLDTWEREAPLNVKHEESIVVPQSDIVRVMNRFLTLLLEFRIILVGVCLFATWSEVGWADRWDLAQKKSQTDDPVYAQFDGKNIRSIKIQIADIFPDSEPGSFYQTANNLKISTRESVVQQELLFSLGQPYSDFRRIESIRSLRQLGFLRSVAITPTVDGDQVDIQVDVSDTWTLIPQLSYSTGDGEKNISGGISESNVMGYGKRVEALVSEDEGRRGIETVWDDRRVMGGSKRLLAGLFHRVDGDSQVFYFGEPFRALSQPQAWYTAFDHSDTIGRLFTDGDESYIFRQDHTNVGLRYTIARGDPENELFRFSFGYDYIEAEFTQADAEDYKDLNLNPEEVSNDPALLPSDRRYSGPVLGFEEIDQDFISMNFIDRFERVQDYNLGTEYNATFLMAPEALGSLSNALIGSANRNKGFRFSDFTFLRTEIGAASRLESDGFSNTLLRGEIKFFSVIGSLWYRDHWLGKHTLAVSSFLDYGDDLDADRQFLVGGDNVIRGYSAKTLSGDKRLALNIEDRIHLVDDAFRLVSMGLVLFADVGGASYDPLGTMIGDQMYSDLGVGLRFAFPRSSGGRVIRVDLSFPLRDGPDGSDAGSARVIFGVGQLFSSELRSESLGVERANVGVGFDR